MIQELWPPGKGCVWVGTAGANGETCHRVVCSRKPSEKSNTRVASDCLHPIRLKGVFKVDYVKLCINRHDTEVVAAGGGLCG